MKFLVLIGILLVTPFSMADEMEEPTIVEFVIQDGTDDSPWNDEMTPIIAPMGSIIRFINEDSIRHRLHTNGAPCSHGPNFEPGETWDCKVTKFYSSEKSGPLYDHNFGRKAEVHIEIVDELVEEEEEY